MSGFRGGRRIFIMIIAVAGFLGLACAGPASAATLNWQSQCTDYQHFTVWKTSTQWARVSNRACIEWTTNANYVRAREDLRVDWPGLVTCKASIPGGLNCEATHLKAPIIVFKYARFQLYWNMHGTYGSGSCTILHNHVASHRAAGGTSTDVSTCWSGNYVIPSGPTQGYAVSASIAADVADDGDGEKVLDRTTDVAIGLYAT